MNLLRKALVVVFVVASAVLVAGAWATAKPKTLKLTGVITSNKQHGVDRSVTIMLKRAGKSVGKVKFPHCVGTGTSVVCGGKMRLKGVGKGFDVLFTWGCPPIPPFKCAGSAKSFIFKKGKKGKLPKQIGSITFKTGTVTNEPKGTQFPVKVTTG